MAIFLISKIKPKNGTSPMVDAADVEMPDGKRLSEVDFSGGQGASITVDSELSATSENPVQNKVIFEMVFQFSETLQLLQAAIPTDAHINDLIDAKLGVIENAEY